MKPQAAPQLEEAQPSLSAGMAPAEPCPPYQEPQSQQHNGLEQQQLSHGNQDRQSACQGAAWRPPDQRGQEPESEQSGRQAFEEESMQSGVSHASSVVDEADALAMAAAQWEDVKGRLLLCWPALSMAPNVMQPNSECTTSGISRHVRKTAIRQSYVPVKFIEK